MTMYGAPFSSWPTSDTLQTCSLRSRALALASRRKRWTISGSSASASCTTLRATCCSSCRCVATATTPMPPRPRIRSIRNLPPTIEPTSIIDRRTVARARHGGADAPARRRAPTCDDPTRAQSDMMAVMRASSIAVTLVTVAAVGPLAALAGCHPAEPPAAPAPKGPTACARASDSMVQTMLDRLSQEGPPPTEAADALRNLIRERCEQDGWSPEATKCLIAMTSVKDAEPCARLMTEEQQAALVRDETALFGPADSQATPAAAPAGSEPARSDKPNT